MTKVQCPCIECVHNKNQVCKLRELKLIWRNMATVNEGRVSMWVCDSYQLSDQSLDIEKEIRKYMSEKGISS